MTLDVENLHSSVHHKSQVSTPLQYARDFGSTAKEGLKRTTCWSAYYYTNRGSWYPLPERSLGLFDIPPMEQPPVGKASHDEMAMMREWCKTYGASVRQRSVRQETTMAKAGTLPDYLYQKDVTVSDKIILTSDAATAHPVATNAITEADAEDSSTFEPVEPNSGEPEEEQSEYDSSSDEETTEEDLREESDNLGNVHLSRDVNFLVGMEMQHDRKDNYYNNRSSAREKEITSILQRNDRASLKINE
ncbi:hypothetical protein ACROYT_G021396 [Oculina patagonica]